MNTKYSDLINQTYYFPQTEFKLNKDNLQFHNIDLMKLVEQYGTPLKFTYLPQISENINKAKAWFRKSMEKNKYEAKYYYCYCTKSSHFEYIMNEAFKNNIHIETSSAFDVNIVENLLENGKINKSTYVICNGFKRDEYVANIARLINNGHKNTIPIIDNYEELDLLQAEIKGKFKIGIRIAAEEEPKFEFYTSRLGIGYKNIVSFYKKQIQENDKLELKMLHFFINTGINDNIFTEFGSFTVGESGGAIYQILYQKQQNDREKWNMIDSSFITTLPDTWAINKRFIMLAINRWNDTYERVLLGGLTCDSDDYYNSEQNMNAIYLPKYSKEKPLYIGFFNTGAYQETIGGYGGLHHCLIPQPKHILIDRDENGILATEVFSEQQTSDDVLKILGYKKKM
jgi:arginine decarboxylase-like protein